MKQVFFLLICMLGIRPGFSQSLIVTRLQCESKTDPIVINSTSPGFSWQLESPLRGVRQVAYRLLVADNERLLQNGIGNIWDSKKVSSARSIHIIYSGKPLQSSSRYFWKVYVWDNKNHAAVSSRAQFSLGLLTQADWSEAKWIAYEEMHDSLRTVPGVSNVDTKRKLGPDKLKQRTVVPFFNKTFYSTKKLTSAMIHITGLGQYELNINGSKIGKSFMSPGWTHYDKRILYNSFDVTNQIRQGSNAIGVIVGNGFFNINRERYIKLAIAYGHPMMICKLVLRYSDGSVRKIVSDTSWRTTASPITFASLYGGEDYDANKETPGWNTVHFDSRAWKKVTLVYPPKGNLEAEMDYPVMVNQSFAVKNILKPKDSVFVYDFGQNLSGIIEMKVKGKKGQVVKLSPAELLHENQLANQNATGKPYYYSYTLKGDGTETWRPMFTYTGFRYVQVEGAVPADVSGNKDLPAIVELTSLHTSNSSPSNGSFECSNQLFNRIDELIHWAIKSNIHSVITDCPHREKLSWLEQDYLMGASINANYNVYHLLRKIVYDMIDAQTAEGLVPDIAPEFVFFDDKGFGFRDSPEWGSASVIVPWLLYKWYGDIRILRDAYPMMKKYVVYLQGRSRNHILDYGLGDWFDYGPNRPGVAQLTPKSLTGTAIYFYDVKLLSTIAAVLNYKDETLMFKKQAEEIRQNFNDTFFNARVKVYATGSQTAMAMPLALGLVNDSDRDAVMKNMVDSINLSGNKLTAGDIGFHFLVEALQNGGASQLIYDMNFRDDVPGYGYQLRKGATALTESWSALPDVSNNHLMLGHIMQWFYEGLGGIRQADDAVAYSHILIKPEVVGDIRFVKTNHRSVYGDIVSNWERKGKEFKLQVSIPANTKATLLLPANAGDRVKESNMDISAAKEVRFAGFGNGRMRLEVGSGTYVFSISSK